MQGAGPGYTDVLRATRYHAGMQVGKWLGRQFKRLHSDLAVEQEVMRALAHFSSPGASWAEIEHITGYSLAKVSYALTSLEHGGRVRAIHVDGTPGHPRPHYRYIVVDHQ
jgi:hypothetical protein